jgi:hypothetical protein
MAQPREQGVSCATTCMAFVDAHELILPTARPALARRFLYPKAGVALRRAARAQTGCVKKNKQTLYHHLPLVVRK